LGKERIRQSLQTTEESRAGAHHSKQKDVSFKQRKGLVCTNGVGNFIRKGGASDCGGAAKSFATGPGKL